MQCATVCMQCVPGVMYIIMGSVYTCMMCACAMCAACYVWCGVWCVFSVCTVCLWYGVWCGAVATSRKTG